MAEQRDTIFALSTPPGRSGIAVLRLSGPQAGAALGALLDGPLPPPRRARLAALKDPASVEAFDRALVLWLPRPASFTGEDMAELHLHGGRAVVGAAVEALARLPGLAPAEPGAFTRRAFENGKLDLSEVEGLADLIAAETEAQRRQALRQMAGGLTDLTEGWRQRLLSALAHVEAAIDFVEEDLPEDLLSGVQRELSGLAEELARHLAAAPQAERLRSGLQVAIVGPPNSGKSSLLNALARRDVAIVAETAGTTRDVIEVHLDLAGYPLVLADTAGLRAAGKDAVEAEGVRRSLLRAAEADLRLAVFDLSLGGAGDPDVLALLQPGDVILWNKADRCERPAAGVALEGMASFVVSARTGAGLEALLAALSAVVAERLGVAAGAPALTRARHRQAIEDCRAALSRAAEATLPELLAEDLRLATRALGRIAGRVDVEDVLDVIFREFCIGK